MASKIKENQQTAVSVEKENSNYISFKKKDKRFTRNRILINPYLVGAYPFFLLFSWCLPILSVIYTPLYKKKRRIIIGMIHFLPACGIVGKRRLNPYLNLAQICV